MDLPDTVHQIVSRKPYLRIFFPSSPRTGEPPPIRFQQGTAKNGQAILFSSTGEDPWRPLSSSMDPGKEAERLLPSDAGRWKGTEIVCILGAGNPHLLTAVARHLRPGQICIAVDAHLELGRMLLAEFPSVQEFLLRPGTHLFCGEEMLTTLWTYIDSIPTERLSGIRTITHGSSFRLQPRFYESVQEQIARMIQAKISDMLTRFEFERNWIRNILINSRHFPRASSGKGGGVDVNSLRGMLKGSAALLVAAGPSLKESLPWIREVQNRLFILACDTAYKVLVHNGIRPHGVVALDAQKQSLFHFLGEAPMEDTILFTDIVIHPSLLRYLRPRHVVFSTTARFLQDAAGQMRREVTAGTEYIEEIYGMVGHLQSGGSVATTAFDLLRNLGADPILLVGQDLAYTGRKIHSTGTHHNGKWLAMVDRTNSLEGINEAVIRKRQIRRVEALDGSETITDYVLDLYRHWFEESLPESGVRVINLTARGARINAAERPEDPAAFALTLPAGEGTEEGEVSLRNALLECTGSLREYLHPEMEHLMKDLGDFLNGRFDSEELFSRHPWLKFIGRRSLVFSRRYGKKIGEERAQEIYIERVTREIHRLHRSLLPYHPRGDNGSDARETLPPSIHT